MRAFDRDLIRGGHYGQRSCEPHLKAEHMAAPTNAANVKKALANSEPSTHGTTRKCRPTPAMAAFGSKADSGQTTDGVNSLPRIKNLVRPPRKDTWPRPFPRQALTPDMNSWYRAASLISTSKIT